MSHTFTPTRRKTLKMFAGLPLLPLGAGVSGSLALKQAATSDADLGLEFGLSKLNQLYDAGSNLLGADNSTYSYYASVDPKTAAKDLPWTTALVAVAAADNKLGNEVRYMIHRLCSHRCLKLVIT